MTILTVIIISSFGIKILERPLASALPSHYFNLQTTCFWWTVVTFTTVGYGDYYPYTLPGRVWAVLLFFFGAFLSAMIVVTLSNTFAMNCSEAKVYYMIKKLDTKDNLEIKSSVLISYWWRLSKLHLEKDKRTFSYLDDFRLSRQTTTYREAFKDFKNQKREFLSYNGGGEFMDFLINTIEKVNLDFKQINLQSREIISKYGFLRDIITKKKRGKDTRIMNIKNKMKAIDVRK